MSEDTKSVQKGEAIWVASKEGGFDATQEFEAIASPSLQVEACYRTLTSLTNSHNGYLNAHEGIVRLRDTISDLMFYKEDLDNDSETAKFVVHSTVLLLDVAMVDLIVSKQSDDDTQPPKGSKSEYYRDATSQEYIQTTEWGKDVESIIPITVTEAGKLCERIHHESVVHTIDDVIKILDEPSGDKGIFFGSSVTKDQLVQIKSLVSHSKYADRKLTVHVPVRFGDIVIILQVKASNTVSHDDYLYKPLSYVPLQDIWQEILQHGTPIYPDTDLSYAPKKNLPTKSFSDIKNTLVSLVSKSPDNFPESIRLIRKYRAALESHISFSQAEHIHETFYANEFGRIHNIFGKPESIITRSGVSANETALLAASAEIIRTLPDTNSASIYFHHGWYFENLATRAKDNIRIFESDERNAQIICINHDPTISYPEGSLAYEESRKSLIERTIERARQDPLNRYAIIYDKTTDLNASVLKHDNLPENLSIYETMSLSKHQRGDRNGFYGALLHWGSIIHDELKLYRTQALGEPTAFTIATFPYVNSGFIQRTIEHNHSLSEAMLRVFDDSELEQPWLVEPYNYFAYIMPPLETVLNDMLQGWMRNDGYIDVNGIKKTYDQITHEDKEIMLDDAAFKASFRDRLKSYVSDTLVAAVTSEQFTDKSIYLGDSFGLNVSRVVMLHNVTVPFGNKKIVLTLPRFSFGRHTTKEEVVKFFTEVLQLYKNHERSEEQLYQEYLELVMRFGRHVTYY